VPHAGLVRDFYSFFQSVSATNSSRISCNL
jgi:hypothetical protein